jgi:LemA protein
VEVLLFVLLPAFILTVYAVALYNRLVLVRNNVRQAWANIDVLMKQRHDELPKLIEVCSQYMRYERAALERLTRARALVSVASSRRSAAQLGPAEQTLRRELRQLFAVSEAFPDLRANATFAHLQRRIADLETAIADRREFYNDTVRINNAAIEQFPAVIFARLGDFERAELLRFGGADTADVAIGPLLNRTADG